MAPSPRLDRPTARVRSAAARFRRAAIFVAILAAALGGAILFMRGIDGSAPRDGSIVASRKNPSGPTVVGKARRVVTGHNADGRSIVLSDGAAPYGATFGDVTFTEMWRTTSSPAPIEAAEHFEPTDKQITLTQPNGSVLRLVDYAPPAEGGKRTPMHRTRTVDYAIVLSGEIVLVLDDSEVVLKAGDVAVQRGTNHAWENRSDKPSRVAFVLLDGAFNEDLAKKLPNGVLVP